MNILTKSTIAFTISSVVSSAALATTSETNSTDNANFFGNLRVGYINTEDDAGNSEDSSAIGGKLGYVSSNWHGLRAGGTLYVTQELFSDDNGDFFASDGASYAILGEAFIQGNFGNTEIKAGRFEFDSPYADTDDIRMIPNTFSGLLISNTDIKDTTLYLAHLDKWAGVDATTPEKFTDMNSDDSISVLGAVYEGVDNLALQSWYYHGSNFANLVYLEAMYEVDNFTLGAQFSNQSDDSADNSGPDGDVYGITASYSINDFTLSTAYNKVSGTVTNGFGGGPFFTSADDHTIDGVVDQGALALGVEYTGFDGITLGLLNVTFDEGEDELDLYAAYELSETMAVEFVFTEMHDDGNIARVIFNSAF